MLNPKLALRLTQGSYNVADRQEIVKITCDYVADVSMYYENCVIVYGTMSEPISLLVQTTNRKTKVIASIESPVTGESVEMRLVRYMHSPYHEDKVIALFSYNDETYSTVSMLNFNSMLVRSLLANINENINLRRKLTAENIALHKTLVEVSYRADKYQSQLRRLSNNPIVKFLRLR